MIAEQIRLAEDYFTAPRPGIWRWNGAGCTEIEVTCFDRGIIAFRDEITQILAELQPGGWPPFTPLLLLCAACRDSWPTTRHSLTSYLHSSSKPPRIFIDELAVRLDRLFELPASERHSVASKIQLVQILFEGTRRWLSPEQASVALQYLQTVLPHRDAKSLSRFARRETNDIRFREQTHALFHGLLRISPETVQARRQTGLDQSVVPAPVPLLEDPPTFGARIAQWCSDPELYGVARMARQLLSILTWPRGLSQPDAMPQGGLSDLTNRGTLDRLLLSELAQDDDTLAVRIAHNEALYLRRECPPQYPPQRRAVLVDTGLRMWGRPRVFAAAVALALATAQDQDPDLSVAVDVADLAGRQPVDLTTRRGTIELLSRLSPALHPGDLLSEWANQHHRPDSPCDLVLITTETTLKQPEFQAQFNSLPQQYFVVIVNGNGQVELRQRSAHGWRTLQSALLPLDDLLTPPVSARPLSLTVPGPVRWPAIFRTTPFPLRLTHPFEPTQAWPIRWWRMVSLAPGGRVMLWDSGSKASLQLATDLPQGRVESWRTEWRAAAASPDDSANIEPVRTSAVVRGKSWSILHVDLLGKTCTAVAVEADAPNKATTTAILVPECLFLINDDRIAAHSLSTGERIAELSLDGQLPLKTHGNRFVQDQRGHWFRLAFDGTIHLSPTKWARETDLLVEIDSTDEPVRLPAPRGTKIGENEIPYYEMTHLIAAYQYGEFVALEGRFRTLNEFSCDPTEYRAALWNRLELPSWWGPLKPPLENGIQKWTSSRFHVHHALRYKFKQIACHAAGIFLQTSKQDWWQLVHIKNRLQLVTRKHREHAALAVVATPFDEVHHATKSLSLRRARLPNGNEVWLDSRGMMHLIPASSDQPEITLVLDEHRISGWVSDGRLFGDEFYTGTPEGESLQVVWETLLAPFFGVQP